MAETIGTETLRGRDLTELATSVSALRDELLRVEAENADLVRSFGENNRRSAQIWEPRRRASS